MRPAVWKHFEWSVRLDKSLIGTFTSKGSEVQFDLMLLPPTTYNSEPPQTLPGTHSSSPIVVKDRNDGTFFKHLLVSYLSFLIHVLQLMFAGSLSSMFFLIQCSYTFPISSALICVAQSYKNRFVHLRSQMTLRIFFIYLQSDKQSPLSREDVQKKKQVHSSCTMFLNFGVTWSLNI